MVEDNGDTRTWQLEVTLDNPWPGEKPTTQVYAEVARTNGTWLLNRILFDQEAAAAFRNPNAYAIGGISMKRTLISLLYSYSLPRLPRSWPSRNKPAWSIRTACGVKWWIQSGNIRYANLTDLGTVQQSANWMPSIPGIGSIPGLIPRVPDPQREHRRPADRHPPCSSWRSIPRSQDWPRPTRSWVLGAGMALEAPGIIKGMLQGYIDPAVITSMGYTNPDDFFTDVIAGKQNIWSVLGPNTAQFLSDSCKHVSLRPQPLHHAPALHPGRLLQDPRRMPGRMPACLFPSAPPSCSTPIVTSGAITVTAHKLAPSNPLVVGQDTAKRGVDVTWEVRVEPTVYIYGVSVPVMGKVCVSWDGTGTSNCTTSKGEDGILQQIIVRYDCEQRTQLYPEGLNWVTPSASLSQTSRDWILNTLSIMYPNAYLHHPTFSFAGNPGTGSLPGQHLRLGFHPEPHPGRRSRPFRPGCGRSDHRHTGLLLARLLQDRRAVPGLP